MELLITGDEVLNLAFYGVNTRIINIYKNSKKTGELFIQGSDLFTTNMFSIMARLKNNEIDEVNYQPSIDELIIIKNDGGKIFAIYYTDNKKKLIDLKNLLEKFKK